MTIALFQLTIVILLASGLGVLARLFRQPTILAYLATGAIIGYFGFFNVANQESLKLFADLGVMFLLFLIGLEINYTSLRLVGKTSLIVGSAQIVFSAAIGFFLSKFLGFGSLESLYIAIALTFSSTIIVVKLLADKKDLNSLYGKISVGFLLVQDFVAILVLIVLAGFEVNGGISLMSLLFTIVKGVGLFVLMLWLGRKYFPIIFDMIANSSELLFLASLAWVLTLASIVNRIGFSIEIAGFLAGLALANSSEHYQIASRIRPLRDFFIVIFFVILGSSILFANFAGFEKQIIILSLFVLIGNPLIVWAIMGFMGYRKRTFFLAGITVAQISEFSLITASRGFQLGHISDGVLATITAVGVITITLSTYLIVYGEHIFKYAARSLSVFERISSAEDIIDLFTVKKQIIIIGCHRIGQSIARGLPKQNILIVDFDPETISRMRNDGFDCLFGDIADEEIFEKANFEFSRLAISTSPNFEANAELLENLQKLARR
ncbi:MAG: cation:proton antiporter, partial [Patescibacteria group bacterium]